MHEQPLAAYDMQRPAYKQLQGGVMCHHSSSAAAAAAGAVAVKLNVSGGRYT
jgi:hypothetical protein